mmetsp:Transcript_27222/g.78272  ORF Transcript_27222/g.78272 Transcript_27222/m.78272 type:complete len:243 (+) Transcript_27222:92-820(+)
MPSLVARMSDDGCGLVPHPRRNAPLPPLDGPRGLQRAAVVASSMRSGAFSADGSPNSHSSSLPVGSPLSSVRSSRLLSSPGLAPARDKLSPGGSGGYMDPLSCSRSTSASSCQGGGRSSLATPQSQAKEASAASSGNDEGVIVEGPQSDAVIIAMLPVVIRGMASTNRAVFRTTLESLQRIERMFGGKAIDPHLDAISDGIQKQLPQPGGEVRAGKVLEALIAICSEEGAAKLRARFPGLAP